MEKKSREEIVARSESSRASDNRDAQIRTYLKMDFVDPLYIDLTLKPEDVDYHWVRDSVLGQPDDFRMVEMQRRGWTPVPPERHPELKVAGISHRKTDERIGVIYNKGLILCERPKEYGEIERESQRKYNVQQMMAIPGLAQHMNDPLMPMNVLRNETHTQKMQSFKND